MNNNFPCRIYPQPPVGYRFHPTDEELIVNYLKPKVEDDKYQNPIIGAIDICKYEPWDLPAWSMIKSNDRVWYFYSAGEKKFTKSKQMNRTTKEGYWKSTGKPRLIKSRRTKKVIGNKRTLVYHLGRPKGIRTEWVMHEYKQQGNIVLCKLKKKSEKKCEKDDTNDHDVNITSTFDCQNQELDEMNSINPMPTQDKADTNFFLGFDSMNQSIGQTTNASDLASQDIVDTNYFFGFDSINQSISQTTNVSDLVSQDIADTNYFFSIDSMNPSISQTTNASDLTSQDIVDTNYFFDFDSMNPTIHQTTNASDLASQDIVGTNYFFGFDSMNQSIRQTANASDLACDGSDVSFHITSPTDVPSLSGMTTNTTEEISVSNLEISNMDKQDNTSATSSANFGIFGQQEKIDDQSSIDGLMISDFLLDLDNYEVDNIWALVDSMLEQEDIGNFDFQMPTCFEESNSNSNISSKNPYLRTLKLI